MRAPAVDALFAAPSIVREQWPDGSVLLRSTEPLGPYGRSLGELLRRWARAAPDRILATQRDQTGAWQTLTYAQARARADALGQARLDLGFGPERPVAVLSGDSLEHLLVTLACYTTGVPVAPVSVAYSLRSRDHARLRAVAELLNPGLVFADDGEVFAAALETFGAGVHVPERFDRSPAALAEIPPTIYFNVPAGFAMLTPHLERDHELARRFFSRLRLLCYAAAALPEAVMQRLRRVSEQVTGGATETAPAVTSAHFEGAVSGCLGVPIPGVVVKLAPTGRKLELRVKGPNVTPGYLGRSDLTAAAFDEEGFYRTGDAGRLVDPEDPNQGLVFDGRIAEDFKLSTGTWVHAAAVRSGLLSAAGGVLQDAVIAGHDRDQVTALGWVHPADAAKVLGSDPDAEPDLRHPALREHLARALAALNQAAGSASRVGRLLLLEERPSLDAGEITDKGYISQRAVLTRRHAEVERLYANPPPPEAILPAG